MEITSNPVVYKIILGVSGLYMLALNRYFSKYYYKSNYYKLDITIKENKYKKTILLSLIMFIPIIMHKLASLTKDTLENQNSSYFLVLCFEFLFMLTFTDKPFKISKKTSFLSVIGILEIVKSFMFIKNDESFIPLFNIFITTSICILLIVNCILNLAQYGNRNIEQTRFNENFRYINRNIIPLNYDTSLTEQVETTSTLSEVDLDTKRFFSIEKYFKKCFYIWEIVLDNVFLTTRYNNKEHLLDFPVRLAISPGVFMILTLQTLQVENLNFHYYLIVLGYAISLFNLLIYNTYVGALYLKAYNLALCCGFYFLYYVFIIDISEKLNNISFILGNIFISLNLFIPLIDSTYSNLVRNKQSMQYTSFLHLSILSNLLISIQSLFTGLIVDNYIYRISLIMNICLLVFPMIFGRFNSNQIPTNIFIPISALICLYYYFISIN